jgi:hypothetical protein
MKALDKGLQFEEQILMQREIAGIKQQMQQIVDMARAGMHPMQSQMMHAQMLQMHQRVTMIRQRCAHTWSTEYVSKETLDNSVSTVYDVFRVCTICELYQEHTS